MKMYVRPGEYREVERGGYENYWCPEGVHECSDIFDGVIRTWKEYVPPSYTPDVAVPLVLSLHGGNSGKGHHLHFAETRAAWATVAEGEGFIVLYPQSLTDEITWNPWNDYGEPEGMKDDLRYMDWLIDRTMETYNIDRTRIYLHGHSFGDVMGSYYALMRGKRFAAAALFSGPACADRYVNEDGSMKFGAECALPVVRIHGSEDVMMPMGRFHRIGEELTHGTCDPGFRLLKESGHVVTEKMRKMKMELFQLTNIALWRKCNQCADLPEISIRGKFNVAVYPGSPDFIFYAVEGGVHCPDKNMADYVWRYFFSGYRRVDGEIVKVDPIKKFRSDEENVALAVGSDKAYVNNKIVALGSEVRRYNGHICICTDDIEKIWPELDTKLFDDGHSVVINKGTCSMQFAASNKIAVWNDELISTGITRFDGGQLYVPVLDIAGRFWGLNSAEAYDVVYLGKHQGQLTYDLAYLILQILGVIPKLSPMELLKLEEEQINDPANYSAY